MQKRKRISVALLLAIIFIGGSIFCAPCFGQEDSESNSITYEYDKLNRVVKATYPDGTVVTYEYDRNGNIIEIKVIPPEDSSDENVSTSTEENTSVSTEEKTTATTEKNTSVSTEEKTTATTEKNTSVSTEEKTTATTERNTSASTEGSSSESTLEAGANAGSLLVGDNNKTHIENTSQQTEINESGLTATNQASANSTSQQSDTESSDFDETIQNNSTEDNSTEDVQMEHEETEWSDNDSQESELAGEAKEENRTVLPWVLAAPVVAGGIVWGIWRKKK